MAHLSILGTGNMGQAIAAVAGKGGHTVQLLGSSDTDTPVTGDVVVLAVPYPALREVVAQRGEQLAGKIVVDITNPLNFETFDSLVVPADGSAAAESPPRSPVAGAQGVQHHLRGHPRGRTVGPLTTTVLIAGDDSEAKSTLAGIVTSGGLKAIDAGSLNRARELEALGFLQLTLAINEKALTGVGSASSPDTPRRWHDRRMRLDCTPRHGPGRNAWSSTPWPRPLKPPGFATLWAGEHVVTVDRHRRILIPDGRCLPPPVPMVPFPLPPGFFAHNVIEALVPLPGARS